MKIRNGFVSNSSSSSFLICTKEELTKESLIKIFEINENSPLFPLANEIADFFIENSEKKNIEQVKDEYSYDGEIEDHGQEIIDYINSGYNVYEGIASDEEGGIEGFICNQSFNIKKDNIILIKEDGY